MTIVFGTPEANRFIRPEIAVCPFCGHGTVSIVYVPDDHYVECSESFGGCGARGPMRSEESRAIKAWNTRTPQVQP